MEDAAKKPLLPREQKFINNYFECNFNATLAYLKTFDEQEKDRALRNKASRLANKPNVKAEIQRLLKEDWESRNVTRERVLNELESIAFGFGSDKDKLKALEMFMKHYDMLVEKVEVKQDTIEVKIIEEEESEA